MTKQELIDYLTTELEANNVYVGDLTFCDVCGWSGKTAIEHIVNSLLVVEGLLNLEPTH